MNNAIDAEMQQLYDLANNLTEKQKDEFRSISDLLIALGKVKPIEGVVAMREAIDAIARDIVQTSVQSLQDSPGATTEECLEQEPIKDTMAKIEESILMVAFGTGIHKAIIDVMIAERVDHFILLIENNLN